MGLLRSCCPFPQEKPGGIKYRAKLERKHGKAKSLTILAHKLARAVYNILKKKEVFHPEVFFAK